MGKLAIREEASTPSTPSEGVVIYTTAATPSIPKFVDDSGGNYQFVVLAKTQTFTTTQTIAPTATNVNALVVNMPTSNTAKGISYQYNGAEVGYVSLQAADRRFDLEPFDNGSSYGPFIQLGRNSNGSTPSAAWLNLVDLNATGRRIWPDASGNLRIGTSNPTNANDTSGTVVGTQTSWHERKENITKALDTDAMLQAVLNVQLYDYQMREDTYKNSDGSQPTYTGIVINEHDRRHNTWYGSGYGENQIPALNERNLFGYLIGAIQALTARVEELEEKLNGSLSNPIPA